MNCQGCGASYDSSFKFCPHCGRARQEPPTVRVVVEEPKYEYCTIREVRDGGANGAGYWVQLVAGLYPDSTDIYHYEAKGTGSNADTIYAASTQYRYRMGSKKYREEERAAWREITGALEADGWQRTEHSEAEYRRRAR